MLMGLPYHYLSVDILIMLSNNCQIAVEQVVVMFVMKKVTITTVKPVKTPLILTSSAYNGSWGSG